MACGLLYFDLGGRLNTARSVIDFATLAIGFGTLLWFTALQPLAGMNAAQLAANWSAAGYGIGNAIALIAGAMVAMQITDWRNERPLVWLLVAMVATLVADLLWVNAELRGVYAVGGGIDFAYFFFYLCLFLSAWAQRRGRAGRSRTRSDCRATCAARCRWWRCRPASSRCSTIGCSSRTSSRRC